MRIRRLAIASEPLRTSRLLYIVANTPIPDLVSLTNALHVDRVVSGSNEPGMPRGVKMLRSGMPDMSRPPKWKTPTWAVALPIEFFAAIERRLWPDEFHERRAGPAGTWMKDVESEICMMRDREARGWALRHDADVKKRPATMQEFADLSKARRGQDSRAHHSPKAGPRSGPRVSSAPDDALSDQQLVHEFINGPPITTVFKQVLRRRGK